MNFFFQNNPCKHPIVVLKDTSREEAAAMLEFAYTGEVHTKISCPDYFIQQGWSLNFKLYQTVNFLNKNKLYRCFRIKGLDKMECPDEVSYH